MGFKWKRGVIKPLKKEIKKGDVVIFTAATYHPMDSGFQKDKTTNKIKPKFFVKELKIFFEDILVCSFDFEVSASPKLVVKFPLRVFKSGRIKALWEDNLGNILSKSVKISVQN